MLLKLETFPMWRCFVVVVVVGGVKNKVETFII